MYKCLEVAVKHYVKVFGSSGGTFVKVFGSSGGIFCKKLKLKWVFVLIS